MTKEAIQKEIDMVKRHNSQTGPEIDKIHKKVFEQEMVVKGQPTGTRTSI